MKGSFVFRPLVFLLFSTATLTQGNQALQYNREYTCGSERIVVAYCRRDGDRPGQRTPDAANYCSVHYPGQKTASGWPVEKAELRSDVETKLRGCGALAGTTSAGGGGGTTITSSGNAAFLRGRELVNAKNYTGAMVELKEALRLDPRHALAFYYVGVAQYYLKEYVVANAAFERALQLNVPIIEHHTVYVWIGECLKALGQHDKALSAYREAIRMKPDYAEAFNRIGLVYHLQKDFPNAVIFYEQAARLDPRTGMYRKNVGMAHIAAGKKDDAMKAYNALVSVDAKLANELLDEITKPTATTTASTNPRTPAQMRFDEANKFYSAKDYPKALASYQEALRLDPAFGEAAHRIGMSRNQLKQYPEAIAAFENAAKLKYAYPHFSYEWIGDTHTTLKQYDKAVLAYKEAVRLKPDYVQVLRKLGNSHYILKQYAETLAAYQTAIKIVPDGALNHTGAGDAYAALGQHDKAAASYREATRLDPKYDLALNGLAVSYYHLKQYAAALPIIEQAVQLKPDNAHYLANLGDTLFQLGRKADAFAVHKKLVTLDKEKADELLSRINKSPAEEQAKAAAGAALRKGHELFNAKEYAKAIIEYQKAVAAKPNNAWLATAYYSIGSSYMRLRDYAQATTNLLTATRLDTAFGDAFGNLGYAYERTLQFPKAVTAYQEAVRLNAKDPPKAARNHESLGEVYALMDRKADARAVYTSLQKSDPEKAKSLLWTIQNGDEEGPAGILVSYGDDAELMGDNEDALEYYRNSAKLPAAKLSARFGAARGLNLLGKPAEAMAILRNVLTLRPSKDDLAATYYHIGQTYNQLREYAKAITEIRKAQQMKVDSDYSYELGNSFFYLKQYPDALVAYQDAVRLKPDDTSSIIRLAETLVAVGQHDKAGSYLSELTSGPGIFSFHYVRIGELYFSMKRYSEAVTVYKKAIATYPKNKSLNYGLGVSYVAMGQKQDAMAVYRVLAPLDNELAQKLLTEINKP